MSLDSKLDPLFEKLVNDKWIPGIAGAIYDANGEALYRKAFGVNNLGDADSKPFTTSTPLSLFSTTKLITSVAALQLLEQGKISLHDHAEKYVPELADIPVLSGYDANGTAQYRPQRKKITILNLLTHTAGFTYDFFDQSTLEWRVGVQQKEPLRYQTGAKWAFQTPRIFEAGEDFTYGINTDWLGFVIEAVSGQKLPEYVNVNILEPLGLQNTFANPVEYLTKTNGSIDDLLPLYLRSPEDGSLSTLPAPPADAPPPEVYGGGHFLSGTIDDYSQFLLAIINYGTHPKSKVQILKRETVKKYLFRDFIPQVAPHTKKVGRITSSLAQASQTGQFLPGIPVGWSTGFLVNNADVPDRRRRGSGFWAGLGNLYYWVDPTAGRLGIVVTSVLPFLDTRVLSVFDDMEKVAYGGEPETDPSKRAWVVPLPEE
ncbi:hypothetical protein DV738_g373, partial [Chaetothyriales sp. CBS 135597]